MTDINSLNTKSKERSRIRVGVCDAIEASGVEVNGVMHIPVSVMLHLLHDTSCDSGDNTV